MKYIVIQIDQGRGDTRLVRELPIIFPNALTHAVVAEALQQADDLKRLKTTVVAAGTLSSMSITEPGCAGQSTTLNGLESRGAVDDVLIQMHDYLHGITNY